MTTNYDETLIREQAARLIYVLDVAIRHERDNGRSTGSMVEDRARLQQLEGGHILQLVPFVRELRAYYGKEMVVD